MKNVIIVVLSLVLGVSTCFGQNVGSGSSWSPTVDARLTKFSNKWKGKDKIIHTWVVNKFGFADYGVLYEITDTSINLVKPRNLMQNDIPVFGTNYSNIKHLILREDRRKGKYILRGIPIGVVVGLLVMAAAMPDNQGRLGPSQGEYLAFGAVGGGAVGMLGGLFIGSMKLKIPIKGSKSNFDKSKERLRAISMQK